MMRRRQWVGGHYRTSKNGKTYWVGGHMRNDYGSDDGTGCLWMAIFGLICFVLLVSVA